MKLIVLFLALTATLFTDPVVTENDPSTLVQGVSMITGDFYTLDEDLVVAGTEPIRVHRGYLSSSGDWSPEAHFVAELQVIEDLFVVPEANGTIIVYQQPAKAKKKHKDASLRYNAILCHSPGVTNTASGRISAQTNYQNQYLVVEDKKSITIHAASGTKRRYRILHNQKPEKTTLGYDFYQYFFHLRSEELPNGNVIEYKWDLQNHLTSIRSRSPRGAEYANLTIPEWKDDHPPKGVKKIGSDQQAIWYEYEYLDHKHKQHRTLKAIEPPDEPKRHFTHNLKKLGSGRDKKKVPCLEKISVSNGREISLEYEEGMGKYLGHHYRVKKLYAPIGSDATPQVSHTFFYFPKERYAYVIDAKNNKSVYFWNEDERLIRIDFYEGTDRLHHSEKFLWEGTNIRCKSYFDHNRQPIWARAFDYDAGGNVLVEMFLGQLTGEGPGLQIDERGYYIENGVNKCIKKTTYTNDGRNLPDRQEESSGLVTLFEYYPNTHLLKRKMVCDQNDVKVTHTYEYNADLILVRTIIDDGLTCTIQQITPKPFAPYYGMPEVIEEKYEHGGREILLSKVKLHYCAGGRVERKEVYDANNNHRYSLHFAYDHKGRLERETNPLGWEAIYRYDAVGNRTYARDLSGLETYYDYDFSNRLIKKEEVGSDSIHTVQTYQYDKNHNLILEIDPKGQATQYVLTSLVGRRAETHLPSVSNEAGHLITPVIRASFDSAGNEIVSTDEEGFATHKEYNAYGKPIRASYPDGGEERWTYYLDGTLHSHTDPTGLCTTYTCDYLSRPIRKTISYHNATLAEETYEYQGLHLSAQIDAEGHRTTFTYDRAGRKTAETTALDTTTFQYDEFSRNHRTEQGSLRTVQQYDLLGRIEETREEDVATNHWLRKKGYHYDRTGNTIAAFRWVQENQIQTCERFEYDSQNRLISKTNALGHQETIFFNDHHINPHQQRVLQKTHTDPMGLKTVDTFDSQGRIVRTEKHQNGRTVSLEEKHYNARGKLALQIDTAFMPNGPPRMTRTRWEYDAMGRPTKLIEADQTLHAKITSHTYTLRGEKRTTTKPDGTVLSFSYSPLGFIEGLFSSDQTVYHQMRYNRQGHLIWHDGIERKVDLRGRLLEEKFPQYTLQNLYNPMGQRVECCCREANLLVEYAYNGKDLTYVVRKTLDGRTLYVHQYLAHDLSGNLLASLLPNNLGHIRYRYDLQSRKEAIESPGYSQTVISTDKVGNIFHLLTQGENSYFTYDELYQLTSESGPFNHFYQYDSLYCRLAKDNEHYHINELNQIASHIVYDKNGNPLRCGTTQYTWDALDRLLQIQTPESTQIFTYDSQHRRLSAITRLVQGKENIAYFLYDGQNEIGSFNAHLQLQDLRILGHSPHAEIGASIAIEVAQQIYAPIHDLSGNIAALLPFDGGVLEQTRYSAFGEEIGSRISPWRFSSKRVDERNDLVYYGRRFYQPELGRWLSPDPAGFTDGMNLYAFVHNAPLTHFDEYGLLDMGQWDKTPKERFDEQQGINWGVSRWAKSVSSASIYSTAFVGKAMFPWLECTTPLVDLFSKSINRSIGRFTNHFTPYQFGNADFDRGRQIGYWGSEALSWMSLGFGAIKFGGYSSKFFLSAKNIKKIDPNIVRFSQSSIRNAFRNGMTIDELAISLKNGATKINEIPPIRLVNQNNVLYTLDNRRLEAFRRAGMKIPYKIATAEEIAAEAWKFTSKNGGIFVKIKGE